MPRQTTRRKTEREDVELRPTQSPSLQAGRRFFSSRGNDSAVRDAAAVANAFGVFSEFAGDTLARRAERFTLEGQKAALEGRELTPEEQQRDSFMRGFQAVQDDRDMVELEAQAVDLYGQLDARNLSQEQVASKLDELFRSNYEGADLEDELTRQSMQRILPRWEAVTEKIFAQHQADVSEAVEEDIDAAVSVAIDHEVATTGTLDLEQWNRKLFSMYGPKQSNEELVSAVTSLAIREGRPELIEELAEKRHWQSGAAAPGGIREYDAVLQNAKVQAENQRIRNERREEAAELETLKAQRQQTEAALMVDILEGRDIAGRVSDLIEQSLVTPETARTLLNFQDGFGDDLSAGSINDGLAAKLEVGLYTEAATITDVIEAASSGALGHGRALKSELSRLLRLAGSVQTVSEQRLDAPAARRYRDEIASLLTPRKDAFGNPAPVELRTQAEALRVYGEQVGQGADPAAARQAVLDAARQQREAARQLGEESERDTPEDLLRLLEQGAISESDFDRRMRKLEANL